MRAKVVLLLPAAGVLILAAYAPRPSGGPKLGGSGSRSTPSAAPR